VFAVGVAASAVGAIAIGPEHYVEYVTALPRMTVLADLPRGNTGLSQFPAAVSIAGVVMAYLLTLASSRSMSSWGSAAIAIAAGLIAQPTLGFNYAGLLIPAVIALWLADRPAGLVAVVATPLVAVVSPPLAAAIVIVAALRKPLLDRTRLVSQPVRAIR
jgi:hypothetical protein